MTSVPPRRPGTPARFLLFLAACAGGAVLLAVAFEPGARDRLPVLSLALVLALLAVWRPNRAIVSFAFLFPWAPLLARLLGGTEPLAWPLLLFSGLAAGWTFRFIYDFDSAPEPSGWDAVLRALVAVWILGGAVALARAHTVWALIHGLVGRTVNGAGLTEEAAVRESLLTLSVLLGGAGFFFLLRRAGSAVRRLAIAAAFAGVTVSAFAALLQRTGLLADESRPFWKFTGRLSGGAMDPNALGLLCALGATVLSVRIAVEPRRRAWLAAPLLLMLGGLLLSGSRSGLIVPLVGLPAILLLRRGARRAAAVLGLAAGVGLAALLWLAPRSGTLAGRLAETFDPRLPLQYRVSERPVLWRSAGLLFQRSPIEGAGVGAFSWMLPDVLAEQDRRLPMRDNPGSAYVQALAETGLVGFLLTLALAILVARHAVAAAADPEAEPGVVAAASATLGFVAAQLLGSHWLAPEVCFLFFLLASVVARPPAPRASRMSRLLLRAAVVLYAAAALVAAARTAAPAATFRHAALAGFYPLEGTPGGSFRWTRRTFAVWVPAGQSRAVRLAYFPPDQRLVEVDARDGDTVSWRRTLAPGESVALRLSGRPSIGRPVLFRLSRTFVPKRLGISGDRRELGLTAVLPE
ncbi:MAG: O-antigen ligase family protein [Thermoanaerobaculia bacterium]